MLNSIQMDGLLALALVGGNSVNAAATVRRHNPLSHRQQDVRHLQKKFFGEHEEMLLVQNMPEEINVDPRSTYNEKFMALMNSPCRPEPDGFFGATSGAATRIQYGFDLEIEPLSDVMALLDVLEDMVVDAILMNTFPEMCGLRRRERTRRQLESSPITTRHLVEENGWDRSRNLAHEKGHPSGFRFMKFEEVGTCKPQENDVNFCAIFVGIVDVYGQHQEGGEAAEFVKSQIDSVLQSSDPKKIHEEVAAIRISDQLTSIAASSGDPVYPVTKSSNDKGLSSVGILMIVISCMLVVAIAYYFYIQWSERKIGDTIFSNKKTSSAAFQRRSYKDGYDADERSIRPSPSLEAEDVFDGESFEDEYEGISRASRSTRSSRRIERQLSNPSLLQYSSRASSRSLDIEDLGLDSYTDDEDSKAKRNGELL